MTNMVSTVEQETLRNFTYTCAAGDYIRAVSHVDPEFNLRPLFDELLTFLVNNLPPEGPLPLLDLMELSRVFPARIQVTENSELPAEQPGEQTIG